MDLNHFKGNVKKALALMPPEMSLDFTRLFTMVEKHEETIGKLGPQLMAILGDDVMALAVEWQCKMINMEGLSKVMHEAFGEAGIVVPSRPNAGG